MPSSLIPQPPACCARHFLCDCGKTPDKGNIWKGKGYVGARFEESHSIVEERYDIGARDDQLSAVADRRDKHTGAQLALSFSPFHSMQNSSLRDSTGYSEGMSSNLSSTPVEQPPKTHLEGCFLENSKSN